MNTFFTSSKVFGGSSQWLKHVRANIEVRPYEFTTSFYWGEV